MTLDLFSSEIGLTSIPLAGADVSYLRSLPLRSDPTEIMNALIDNVPWRAENVTLWGKSFPQPRLIAWFGDSGRNYHYSGVALDPLPWTDLLLDLKDKVEAIVSCRFNSVLLNLYRDGNDSMGMHSDDEKELGPRPTIASISLGTERTLVFKSKVDRNAKPTHLKLASGSLLLMRGDTQKNWKHGIHKVTHKIGPRVNLTFRSIIA